MRPNNSIDVFTFHKLSIHILDEYDKTYKICDNHLLYIIIEMLLFSTNIYIIFGLSFICINDLDFFFNKIKEIRDIRPNISITTDIIVGFPGETEELFNKSIETCKKINFSKLHVFPFSERKGTKAVELDKKVSQDYN